MNAILFNRRKYIVKRNPEGAPIDLNDATITLSGSSFPYTGNPITPTATVVYDGATLVVNTDYFVSYADNTNVGAGTVTVTGNGTTYTGTVVKTFQITSAAPSTGWDFDITKTTNVGVNTSITGQNDSIVGYYNIEEDGETTGIGVAVYKFYGTDFGYIYNITKDSSGEYHVVGMSASAASNGGDSTYKRLAYISKDGVNAYYSDYDYKSESIGLRIRQHILGTPGDLTSGTVSGTLDSGFEFFQNDRPAVTLSDNGEYLYYVITETIGGNYYPRIRRVTLTTPFDITTASVSSVINYNVNIISSYYGYSAIDMEISPDGSVIVLKTTYSGPYARFTKFTLSTPYDVTTMTEDGNFTTSETTHGGFTISPDAKSLFIASTASTGIREFSLSK